MLRFFKPKPQLTEEEYNLRLLAKGIGPDGLIPDPVPIAPPIGYKRQPSMTEIVRNAVRSERLALEAQLAGFETFEESEDFDVGDEFDVPRSPHEFEGQPTIAELREAVRDERVKRGLDPVTGEPVKPPMEPKDGGGGGKPPPQSKPGDPPGDPA
nr:MAG: hypothetical protein [Microvirus sp.]